MSQILKLKRTELKVYGWIREAEEELVIGYIPDDIKRICVSFSVIDDAFDYIGENIEMSLNGKCVTKKASYGCTKCYGYYGIIPTDHKCKYKWDILFKNDSPKFTMGISSSYQQQHDEINSKMAEGLQYEYGFSRLKKGDIISMSFDLYYGTICYSQNNLILFFDNLTRDNWKEDTEFRLEVSLMQSGDSVEIKDFSMQYRS